MSTDTGPGVQETTPGQIPQQSERRSVERRTLSTEQQVQVTMDWLRSQREKVLQGKMTQEESDQFIARSIVARDKLTERSKELRKKDPKIDPMTGLLNKGAYIEEYAALLNNGAPFGFLELDVDHFKDVDDRHGHNVGDSVLVQTARNLMARLRQIRPDDSQNDKIFRLGGDEFVVLLPEVVNESDLANIAEKLRVMIGETAYSVTEEGNTIQLPITVSIGGGIYRQRRLGDFFEEVDKKGLYKAKQDGRNRTVIIPA